MAPTEESGVHGIDRMKNNDIYSVDNTVPSCKKCNLMKGAMDPRSFLTHVMTVDVRSSDASEFDGRDTSEKTARVHSSLHEVAFFAARDCVADGVDVVVVHAINAANA